MNLNLDLLPEDKLLLLCARTQIDVNLENEIKSIIEYDLDWDYIMFMATKHKLKPLLYWQLHKICLERVPNQIMANLKIYYKSNARKNLLMFSELIDILKLLRSCGISPIPYKGPILSILVYKNISCREFNDLDFFIQFQDVRKAINIIIQNGYKPLFETKKEQIDAYLKFGRDLVFKTKFNHIFEMQWTFISLIFSINDKPEFLYKPTYKKNVEYNNFKIKTISNEELFLVLCIHNASHYWSSLSMICDISELIKSDRSIKWSEILQKAKLMGIERILIINLILVQKLLKMELPKNIFKIIQYDKSALIIADHIIKRIFHNNPLKMSEKILFHLKIRENYNNKIRDLIILLLIPTPNIIGSISLPSSLYPIYILIRVTESFYNIFKSKK